MTILYKSIRPSAAQPCARRGLYRGVEIAVAMRGCELFLQNLIFIYKIQRFYKIHLKKKDL